MARATAPRNTNMYGPGTKPELVPGFVPVGQRVFQGTMVGRKAGKMVSVSEAGVTEVVGRAEHTVDNTRGGGKELTIEVRRGVFNWGNDGTLTEADAGAIVYVKDDQTVSKAGSLEAGRLLWIEKGTLWIEAPR